MRRRLLRESRRSCVYLVEGGGRDVYVVKVRPAERTPSDWHALDAALSHAGIEYDALIDEPVVFDGTPPLLLTKHRYLPGETVRGAADGIGVAELGRTLGLLHGATAPTLPPAPSTLVFSTDPGALAVLRAFLASADASAVSRRTRDAIVRDLRSLANDGTQVCARLPQALTHGDVRAGNLRSGLDGAIALIDFDSCGIRPRVVDLTGPLVHKLVATAGFESAMAWVEAIAAHAQGFDVPETLVPAFIHWNYLFAGLGVLQYLVDTAAPSATLAAKVDELEAFYRNIGSHGLS